MSAIEIKQVMKQKFPKKTEDEISDAFRKVNMSMTQDQRDAKDYRQKIIAGMSEILQESLNEAKVKDYYHVEKYSPNQFYVEDAEGGDETGPFKTREEAEKECEKRNKKRLQKESLNEKKSGKYVCPKCGNKVKTLEGLKGQADTDDKSSKEKFIHPSKMKIQCPKCKELSSLDNWKYIVESNIDKLLTIFEGNVSDKHQKKIAIDTIKNPDKALLGGPSVKEAEEILRKKFGYTQKQIDQLKEEIEE